MTRADRAELIEQVAKIIAGPSIDVGFEDDLTWREWLVEAEQIVDLLRPEVADA